MRQVDTPYTVPSDNVHVRRRRRGNAVTGLQRDEERGDVGMFCMHVKGMRRGRKGL
jgi:hypothetical protein